MLPSSVRRVVVIAPQAPALVSNLAPRATAAFSLSRPSRHQRRCSSSKPSSPNNGPNDLAAGQSATPSSSTRARKTSTETRGRKPKNLAQQAQNFPSVPSTQHMPLETLALSSFFSQHRPMSITSSLPKYVSDESFAALFQASTSQKTSKVINTLSRTVNQLEGPMASLTIKSETEADPSEDNVHKIDVKHADGTESSVYVQLNTMSGDFLPHRPPPAPEALTDEIAEGLAESVIASSEGVLMASEEHRMYKAVFTIEERVSSDGEVKVVAHSPQVLQEPAPARTFLERMAVRHLRYEDSMRQRESLLAISVKRIRKLRMKKKKYKKLMKRTRNARQKQGRT